MRFINSLAILEHPRGYQLDFFLDLFEKGTLKLRVILEDLLVQAACGISDIHESGLMHRDVKDSNMFVNEIESGVYVLKIGDSQYGKKSP